MEKVFVILGPTGTGKTKISLEFAEKLNGEIINIDSAQFYKNFKIGTGVIKDEEMKNIKHHFFAFFDIDFELSAFSYVKIIEEKIKKILKEKKTPILVGGSHFYINSLFFKEKKAEENIKFDFKFSDIKNEDNEFLYKKLYQFCPKRAEFINKNDRFRILNSLKKIEELGYFPEIIFSPAFIYEIIETKIEDKEIYVKNLEKRIEIFFSEGWINEIKSLNEDEINFLKRKKFIGYDLIIKEIENGNIINLEKKELKEKILSKTLYYAKKQCQFIKKLKNELIKKNVFWREYGKENSF